MTTFSLSPLPRSVHVIVGKKQWRKWCKEHSTQLDLTFVSDGAFGDVQDLSNNDVLVRFENRKASADQVVHEAVHVFQNICRSLGERSPSSEFEAYYVQHIFKQLTAALKEQP